MGKLTLLAALVFVPAAISVAGTAYVANEAATTVTVIDTATDTIVTTIGLGSDPAIPGTPQPNGPFNAAADHHRAFYNGHVDAHGLWLTPDGSVLLVACRISGTVVAIDTATNSVLGYAPVGREPHLATVRPPAGREAWVAVRGESHVDVFELDPRDLFDSALRRTDRMRKLDTFDTVRGPSMVSFTSDGRFAFIAAGKQAQVDKVHADSRRVVASRAVVAPFTPFGLVTPDDRELYLVHKGAGGFSVLRTSDLGVVAAGQPLGARPNHVWFAGRFAYITVGGPEPSAANPEPEGKVVIIDRATLNVVRELTGPQFTGEPHGIWETPEGKLYIGHERGNRITVLALGDPNNADDDVVTGVITGLAKPIDIVARR